MTMFFGAPATVEPPQKVDHFDFYVDRPRANDVRYGKGAYAGIVTVYYSREAWGDRAALLHDSMNGVVERFTLADFEKIEQRLEYPNKRRRRPA
jgi:hypothetical protein